MPRRLLPALLALFALLLAPAADARASFVPDDPGWQRLQWNFTGPFGVDALGAWRHLIAAGRPGGVGVTVAVVDTGVAYRREGRQPASPDLRLARFVAGHDFVDDDPYAVDRDGHGTHVASTIAQATDNGLGLTGLAYGVSLMPVRVLDDEGVGSVRNIAAGVRFAALNGADVINVSLELHQRLRAPQLVPLIRALALARSRGAVVVASTGNEAARTVAFPARSDRVIAVGASTEHGCLSDLSNTGDGIDLVAPGGGLDGPYDDDPRCDPADDTGRSVVQLTLSSPDRRRFVLTERYDGTSMAAAHVSAAAALIIASGVIGRHPSPEAVRRRLMATARDLGTPGPDRRYGAGLLDAEAATRPGPAVRRSAPAPLRTRSSG